MRQIVFTLLCLLGAWATAAEKAPPIPDYEATQVAANTYVIHGPMAIPSAENKGFINNPAFIVTPEGVVVIDPGSSVQVGEMVLRAIAKVTPKKVVTVLNTHEHGDHWLGNQAMRESRPMVPIFGHPNMIKAIEAGGAQLWINNMEQLTEGATRGTVSVPPNMTVNDGDVLTIAGLTVHFHYVSSAHSSSDVMIYVEEEGVLFTGDNVNNGRIVRMDDGSFSGNIAACIKAMTIPAKVFVPGHGQSGGQSLVFTYRDYLSGLYAAVEKYYEQGLSDFEMKPKVAAELKRFKDWSGFEDELGKHISLAYLEIEAKAFR